jgi:hypothetical protein
MHTSYPSRVAPFSLSSKPTLLSLLLFYATAAGDPIEFVFAPESLSDAVDFRSPFLYLQLSQLERIHALRTTSGKGGSASVSATVAALEDAYTDADLFETVCQIRGTSWMMLALTNWCITSVVKLHLTSFLHPSQAEAVSYFGSMAGLGMESDAHQNQEVVGVPCPAPHGATVLRSHWNYIIKPCGTRKARTCCDGSKRAAPELRFAQTYASCIDLSAVMGLRGCRLH